MTERKLTMCAESNLQRCLSEEYEEGWTLEANDFDLFMHHWEKKGFSKKTLNLSFRCMGKGCQFLVLKLKDGNETNKISPFIEDLVLA